MIALDHVLAGGLALSYLYMMRPQEVQDSLHCVALLTACTCCGCSHPTEMGWVGRSFSCTSGAGGGVGWGAVCIVAFLPGHTMISREAASMPLDASWPMGLGVYLQVR